MRVDEGRSDHGMIPYLHIHVHENIGEPGSEHNSLGSEQPPGLDVNTMRRAHFGQYQAMYIYIHTYITVHVHISVPPISTAQIQYIALIYLVE